MLKHFTPLLAYTVHNVATEIAGLHSAD